MARSLASAKLARIDRHKRCIVKNALGTTHTSGVQRAVTLIKSSIYDGEGAYDQTTIVRKSLVTREEMISEGGAQNISAPTCFYSISRPDVFRIIVGLSVVWADYP